MTVKAHSLAGEERFSYFETAMVEVRYIYDHNRGVDESDMSYSISMNRL
jgi:hypothetical protein